MAQLHKGFDHPWRVVNAIPMFPAKVVVQFADWSVRTIDLSDR